jgi:hypothetical protein
VATGVRREEEGEKRKEEEAAKKNIEEEIEKIQQDICNQKNRLE